MTVPPSMHRGSFGALGFVALSMAACVGQTIPARPDPGLADAVIDSPGHGFAPIGRATGPVDLETAANATEAPPDAARAELKNTTFRAGFERLWGQGKQYVGDLVLEFDHPVEARAFVDYEVAFLKRQPIASVYADRVIPGATDFILNGSTRTHPNVFCQGAWFALENRAFNLYHCDPDAPVGTSVLTATALAQYRHALVVQDATSPSPTNLTASPTAP
ncbi:MAG: hypothetical protein ABR573_10045 [Candidatus Dormibacteria bacterium]